MRLRCDEVELPDGTIIPDYYVRESDGFVFIFPVTAAGNVVLTEQYRYGADTVAVELPAGNCSPGEDPAACARRELLEETGYDAAEIELLADYVAEPVRSSARCRIYIARDARKIAEQHLDATEHIDVFEATPVELRLLIADGRMNSLSSVAAAMVGLAAL